MYVKQGDKGTAYVAIDNCVVIAFHSNITKVAQAQYQSTPVSGSTRSPSSEDYPAAYAATHEDMVHSGLSSLSVPTAKEAPHVTCTGVPFDPDNDELKTVSSNIWATPALLLNKAQTAMKSEIVHVKTALPPPGIVRAATLPRTVRLPHSAVRITPASKRS